MISVKNVSGFVSVDKDGNWVCTDKKHRRTDRLPNPVSYFLYGVHSSIHSTLVCIHFAYFTTFSIGYYDLVRGGFGNHC